jgi:hypothetical protein
MLSWSNMLPTRTVPRVDIRRGRGGSLPPVGARLDRVVPGDPPIAEPCRPESYGGQTTIRG